MARIAALVYGALTYLFFLATTLYAVAFVGGRIDRGARAPLAMAVAVDLGLVALFGVQHSVMARRSFKRWIPAPVERTTFVLASAICLDLLFAFWRPVDIVVWSAGGAARAVLIALFWIGWALVVASTFLIDHFDLTGLRQVIAYARGVDYAGVPFKQPAVYNYVRHPLMLSFLVAFWFAPRMTVGHLLFAGGMTAYIVVGIVFEERDLAARYGRAYEEYRTRVPMLVPGMPRRKTV